MSLLNVKVAAGKINNLLGTDELVIYQMGALLHWHSSTI
jgi:hypothetical protein